MSVSVNWSDNEIKPVRMVNIRNMVLNFESYIR